MDATLFQARVSVVAEEFDDECYAEALLATRELKADLLAQALLPGGHQGKEEATQLGWARFYEVKSLFAAEEHQAVYDLISTPEPVKFAIGAKNAGWMFSVGAECAMRLGDVDTLLQWGETCFELREMLPDDPMSKFHSVNTILALLDELDRPDLNRVWAERLIVIGREHEAERPVIAGVRWLLDNFERSNDAEIAAAAQAARSDLVAYLAGRFGDEAAVMLARLDRVCPAA